MVKEINIALLCHDVCCPNLGVSALALSNIYIINKILKKREYVPRFFLFSDIKENELDIDILSDVIDINKVEKKYGFRVKTSPKFFVDFYNELKKCDIIFDTGLGDSFADIYGIKRAIYQILMKRIALKTGKPFILTPQTIGPFKNTLLKKFAFNVIRDADMIFARDNLSYDYVKQGINMEELHLATDMAMLLPYNKDKYRDLCNMPKFKIGINVSGLVFNGGYTGKNQFNLKMDYKSFLDKLISKFYNDENIEIHIIPHVITDLEVESDVIVADYIKGKYPNVTVSPYFRSPIDAKSYIANMDLFIGTRMHATIAAISSGVPVIPVSYSRKFEGLFSTIEYDVFVTGTEKTDDEACNIIMDYFNNIDLLREKVSLAQYRISELTNVYINNINKVFENL